ncbi:hypothetical protein [Parafrankia sp. FMc2]|uniref:hypothetical protein n=1 Tax=Parafrankia sp. FMc2 TaxID=3233196 RepID=UPI0034D75977
MDKQQTRRQRPAEPFGHVTPRIPDPHPVHLPTPLRQRHNVDRMTWLDPVEFRAAVPGTEAMVSA